jgi:hypothetical protein
VIGVFLGFGFGKRFPGLFLALVFFLSVGIAAFFTRVYGTQAAVELVELRNLHFLVGYQGHVRTSYLLCRSQTMALYLPCQVVGSVVCVFTVAHSSLDRVIYYD